MKKTAQLFFTFCISLLFSCGNSSKYAKEIKQLDSISVALDSFSKLFYAIDTSAINQRLKQIGTNLKVIDENIKDTVSFETATVLSEYSSCRKPFRTIIQQYYIYIDNIITAKKQLADLRHDLKIEKIENTKINEYITSEITATNKLINELNVNNEIFKMYSEKQDMFEPKIKTLIDSIQTTK